MPSRHMFSLARSSIGFCNSIAIFGTSLALACTQPRPDLIGGDPNPNLNGGGGRDAVADVTSDVTEDATADASADGTAENGTVDGLLGEGFWSAANRTQQRTNSTQGTLFDGASLTELRAYRSPDQALWIAFEGATMPDASAVVVFIDTEYGEPVGWRPQGFVYAAGSNIDRTIAQGLLAFDTSFWPDAAWYVGRLPHALATGDDTVAARAIRTSPYTDWSVPARFACSATICEARIALDAAYATKSIGIVARLGSTTLWSNQTLPADDGANPNSVTRVLVLPPSM